MKTIVFHFRMTSNPGMYQMKEYGEELLAILQRVHWAEKPTINQIMVGEYLLTTIYGMEVPAL